MILVRPSNQYLIVVVHYCNNWIATRNTSLESAVALTKNLREDIQNLGVRISSAAETEEKHKGTRKKGQHDQDAARRIINEIKDLTKRIEDVCLFVIQFYEDKVANFGYRRFR